MTIKHLGGIFGRNPAFNNADVETLDVTNVNQDGPTVMNLSAGTVAFDIDTNISSSEGNVSIVKAKTVNNRYATIDLVRFGSSKTGLAFYTTNAGTLQEAATFNDVGNLAFPSGQGIDFSATSGTGTSELFDDYEEGTWTSTVGGNATYGVNTARYTKIGRQVFASFDLNITTIGTGSTIEISGLPFTCGDDIAEGVSISFYDGLATNVVEVNAYVFGTAIRFRSLASAGSGLTALAVLGDGCRVTGTAIYTTDS
jgi:hypothetical protein